MEWVGSESLRRLTAKVPGVVFRCALDAEWTMEFMSDGALDVTGYPPSDFLENRVRAFASIIHPADRARVERDVFAAVAERRSYLIEYRIVRSDGAIRWVAERGVGVRTPDDEGVSHLEGVVMDVTEKKELDERFRRSERRYRELYEHAPIAYATMRDGRVTACNAAAESLLRRSRAELLGSALHHVAADPGSSAQLEALAALAPGEAVRDVELRFGTVEGGCVWALCSVEGFADEGGASETRIAMQDITQRKGVERALAEAKNAAEAASRAKSEFLANMSHEIRTPMNAVLGFAEVLARTVDEPRSRKYVDAIRAAGKTLLALINDVLDLAKIEAGKLELRPSATDLRALAAEVVGVFGDRVEGKGVQLTVEIDDVVPPALWLDGIRVRQVLFNLVGNAVKFTEVGHVALSATSRVRRDGDHDLEIVVEDTGVGIPEAELGRIFVAFEQRMDQDPARYGGTGLGLTITRRLLDAMHGTIEVSSVVGAGSRFVVHVPRVGAVKPSPSRFAASSAPPLAADERVVFEPARVLVVDDLENNRQLFRALLDEWPELEALEAENGRAALALIEREGPPALVFTDLKMPVMDGAELAKRLGSRPGVELPVVALTASVYADDVLTAHCRASLRKPVGRDELLAVLTRFLVHRRVHRAVDGAFRPVPGRGPS